jgi:hypothetical protein
VHNSPQTYPRLTVKATITAINGGFSLLGAYKDLPIPTIRGLDKLAILVAFLGAAVGTIIAINTDKPSSRLTFVASILAVFALIAYWVILAAGGAGRLQVVVAVVCYWYVILMLFYFVTLLERYLFKL